MNGHAIQTPPITPTPSSMAFISQSKESKRVDGLDEKENQRGTKTVFPDSSTLISSTDPNPNPNPSPLLSSNSNSTSRPTSTSIDTALFSNRPAPPSPSLSRRVSGAPSIASSTHSSSSNPPRSPSMRRSMGMSRMSSVGSDAKRQSLGIQLRQFTDGGGVSTTLMTSISPLGSPHKSSFTQSQVNPQTLSSSSPPQQTTTTADIPKSDPIPTPTVTPTATTTFSPPPQPTTHMYIKVRDFGFPPTDERHLGLGTDTPKANHVNRLNRKLGGPDRARARIAAALNPASSSSTVAVGIGPRRQDSVGSVGSVDSSDADAQEEEDDGEDEGWGIGISGWGKGGSSKGWDGFRLGMGRFSWNISSSHSNVRNGNEASDKDNDSDFPSRKDLDMNFMDSSDDDDDDDERRKRAAEQPITEEFHDDDDDDEGYQVADAENGEPQEPLYPGLYRALYAFEPEGMAEMKLAEDQIVRVVGRGGGVGWAVVVDKRVWDEEEEGGVHVKHALVPEGYLEAVRLDWEEEEE